MKQYQLTSYFTHPQLFIHVLLVDNLMTSFHYCIQNQDLI
jgi:hypothetical protein